MTKSVEPISKSDRIELRRIVKSRYEVLREQITQRTNEVKSRVKDQIRANHKETIQGAQKESKALAKECKALARKVSTLNARYKDKGIVSTGGTWGSRYDEDKPINKMNDFIENWLEGWQIENLNEQVESGVQALKEEAGMASLNLKSSELELLEDLSVDAIQGEQARKFLQRIPEIDNLLPLPEAKDLKTLKA